MKDKNIKNVIVGFEHSVILKKNGDIFTFGNNSSGQLGISVENKKLNKPFLLLNHPNIIKLVCGAFFTIFLTEKGQIFGFGSNKYSELNYEGESVIDSPKMLFQDENIVDIFAGG